MAAAYVNSPLGIVRLTGSDTQLESAMFVDRRGDEDAPEQLSRAIRELTEYFSGLRQEFTLTFCPKGTEFQKAVWAALCAIPYGQTRTYAQVAQAIGHPKAARAVGNAVGANPCVIFIPCHRVLGKNSIGGFSCGLWRKEALLQLENKLLHNHSRAPLNIFRSRIIEAPSKEIHSCLTS